jgi:hypothetical protein
MPCAAGSTREMERAASSITSLQSTIWATHKYGVTLQLIAGLFQFEQLCSRGLSAGAADLPQKFVKRPIVRTDSNVSNFMQEGLKEFRFTEFNRHRQRDPNQVLPMVVEASRRSPTKGDLRLLERPGKVNLVQSFERLVSKSEEIVQSEQPVKVIVKIKLIEVIRWCIIALECRDMSLKEK